VRSIGWDEVKTSTKRGDIVMNEQPVPIVTLPPVGEIAIIVKDLDRAVDFYSSKFGWGPFRVYEFGSRNTAEPEEGEPRTRVAIARSGAIDIELIEPGEGDVESLPARFLAEKGEGLQHLAFRVEDMDAMLGKFAEAGITTARYARFPEKGIAYAFLNTEIGYNMIELLELKRK